MLEITQKCLKAIYIKLEFILLFQVEDYDGIIPTLYSMRHLITLLFYILDLLFYILTVALCAVFITIIIQFYYNMYILVK